MSVTTRQADPTEIQQQLAGKYLTFGLGRESFGLPILSVQEIVGILPTAKIPRTPEYIRGVVNLRGRVIPVLELRQRLGMVPVCDTERTCIVVSQVNTIDGLLVIGLLVDHVAEVIHVSPQQIEPPPEFGARLEANLVRGLAKMNQEVVMLLEIDHLLQDNVTYSSIERDKLHENDTVSIA